MKLYEEIYIPCQDEDIEAIGIVSGPYVAEFPIKVHSKFDVIVLTIEELRDLYIEGFEDGYDSAAFSNGVRNYEEKLKTYLKSKGIEP